MQNKNTITEDVYLWEAWTERENNIREILYVVGEVPVLVDGLSPSLEKVDVLSTDEILYLSVFPNLYLKDGAIAEVLFSEELQKQKYKSIVILAAGIMVDIVEEIESIVS